MHFLSSSLLLLASTLTGILAVPSHSPLTSRDVPPKCTAYPDHPSGRLAPGKYFKITMLVKKLPHLTDAEFHTYWDTCSIPLAIACPAFRKNVARYYSQHQTPELKAELGALGYPMADYDGITEVCVENLDRWQQVVDSKCWDTVREDALTFTQWPYTFMYTSEIKGFD